MSLQAGHTAGRRRATVGRLTVRSSPVSDRLSDAAQWIRLLTCCFRRERDLKTQGIVFTAPSQAAPQAWELRQPESDELLIETHCTVISAGTERGFYRGAPFYPFTPGYSVAGVVLETGSAVTRFKPGDRVFAVAAHAAHVLCNEAGVVRIPDNVNAGDACFATVGAMAMHAVRAAADRRGY